MRLGSLASAFTVGMVAAHGCTISELDPAHCANDRGDASCAQQFPDGSRPFCERGTAACVSDDSERGCVAQRPRDACYSPCGGRTTVLDDDACPTETSSGDTTGSPTEAGTTSEGPPPPTTATDGDGDTTTGGSATTSPATTGQAPCELDEDCPDPGIPACMDGTCVQCTPQVTLACDEQRTICDGGSNTCVPCTEHEQCGSGACELAEGRCFPAEVVVQVDGDGGAELTTLGAAVNAVEDGGVGVIVVHELDGDASYQTLAGLRIDRGKTIAVLAAAGEQPVLRGSAANPALRVEGAGTVVYLDRLRIAGSVLAVGLQVEDGALAWVDRSRLVLNGGGGVRVGGGAELVLRTSMVAGLGVAPAVEIEESSATVLYSTLGATGFGSTPALACSMPVAVDVRNSIVVSLGGTSPDELQCPGATVTDSATEAEVGAFDNGWFTDFPGGDYTLTLWGAVAFEDLAVWRTGDPTTDIDGDPRPTVDGSADFPGADVP